MIGEIKGIGRRGQIAPTLTWFFAFLIIFFIIIFFTGATLTVAKAKTIPVISWFIGGKSTIEMERHVSENLVVERKFATFLNAPVIVGGERLQVKQLFDRRTISGTESDRVSAFGEAGNRLMKEIVASGIYSGIWVRVYEKTEEISEDYSGNSKDYSLMQGGGCDPADEGAFISSMLVTSTKQIVLCVEYD